MILRSSVVFRSGVPVPSEEQKCASSGKLRQATTAIGKRFSDQVRVLYPSRQFAYHATGCQVGHLKRAGLIAHEIGNKRVIHAVVLCQGPCRPVAGTKYTTRAETPYNPAGVMSLKAIAPSLRPLFSQVQRDCLRVM